jgi:hypothetical protein
VTAMLLSPAGYVMGHRSALVADLKGHRPKPPVAFLRYRPCNLIWDRSHAGPRVGPNPASGVRQNNSSYLPNTNNK